MNMDDTLVNNCVLGRRKTYGTQSKVHHSWLCIGCHDLSSLWLGIQCAGTAVAVSVSNQALLGSPIAGQGNVSDAVSQVVKVQPLYTPVDSKGEVEVGSSVGTVPSGESAVFGCRLSLISSG